MAKRCAREECGKSVYPMEELKCLDKVWHKTCFKCTVCGMALNMKTYKGYNKMPYCEPHYPKTVASVVNDTPEMRRIAENTKNQSQIAYHAEYEKMKGTKIEVADDPETIRHKQNTHTQSNVAYHGDLEKKNRYEAVRPKEVPGDESSKKKEAEKAEEAPKVEPPKADDKTKPKTTAFGAKGKEKEAPAPAVPTTKPPEDKKASTVKRFAPKKEPVVPEPEPKPTPAGAPEDARKVFRKNRYGA